MSHRFTATELEAVLAEQLSDLDDVQREAFERIRVPLRHVPIVRYGQTEHVFVVGVAGDQVIYYDEIEEGFELSILDCSGKVVDYRCSQFELKHLMHQLTEQGTAEGER